MDESKLERGRMYWYDKRVRWHTPEPVRFDMVMPSGGCRVVLPHGGVTFVGAHELQFEVPQWFLDRRREEWNALLGPDNTYWPKRGEGWPLDGEPFPEPAEPVIHTEVNL